MWARSNPGFGPGRPVWAIHFEKEAGWCPLVTCDGHPVSIPEKKLKPFVSELGCTSAHALRITGVPELCTTCMQPHANIPTKYLPHALPFIHLGGLPEASDKLGTLFPESGPPLSYRARRGVAHMLARMYFCGSVLEAYAAGRKNAAPPQAEKYRGFCSPQAPPEARFRRRRRFFRFLVLCFWTPFVNFNT